MEIRSRKETKYLHRQKMANASDLFREIPPLADRMRIQTSQRATAKMKASATPESPGVDYQIIGSDFSIVDAVLLFQEGREKDVYHSCR